MNLIGGLLAQRRPEHDEVSFRWCDRSEGSRSIGWGEFRRDVLGLHARLHREYRGAWVLLTEDAYAFGVGLFALWHADSHAILPPNRQPHTLAALQTRSAGVLTDRADWFEGAASLHPLHDGVTGEPSELGPIRREAVSVELFTSGTTGEEKPVIKRIGHLEDELLQLERCFADAVKDAAFFSTASHQHLYGLLFGVLWPLCNGRAFQAQHALHPGQLAAGMREREHCVLVSVPTTLRGLARHTGTSGLRSRCHVVFSSGGPLATDSAHTLEGLLGHAPIEVLGSTETGGIAHRVQRAESEEALWTPFPCASVSADPNGELRVRSPLVSVDADPAGYATGDRVELMSDGRFRLGGRSDLVVKIGEKRLDLASMASALRAHEWLEDVALTTVGNDAEMRVAAIVVASERGRQTLRGEGRRAFTRSLREALAGSWDPVLHPRLWRVVDELPANAQGKLTQQAAGHLFGSTGRAGGQRDQPRFLEEFRGKCFVERACEVPADLECFDGHFPERPLVPGVLQLDWAMNLLAVLLAEPPEIKRVESLKFLAPLGPGSKFRLVVRLMPLSDEALSSAPWRVEFTLADELQKFAEGRVHIAAPSHFSIGSEPA